jgi:alpha-glucosidase (family GH31 glycosyl hydrolase)
MPERSKWYDFETLKELKSEDDPNREYWFHVPLEKIPVCLRGNTILPYHTDIKMTIAEQTKVSSFGLFVALSSSGEASVQLFFDDGETFDTVLLGTYSLVDFAAKSKQLKSIVRNYAFEMNKLTDVKILGVNSTVTEVKLNGLPIQSYEYQDETKVLVVHSLNHDLADPLTVEWD